MSASIRSPLPVLPPAPEGACESFDGLWYAVAPSRHIRVGARPYRLKTFGITLVAWRDAEGLHAIDDRCPHLGASLSGGRIVDGEVLCPYHGLRFGKDGRCTKLAGLPSKDVIPQRMRNRAWVLQEQGGWIFLLWAAADAPVPPLQTVEALEVKPTAVSISTRTWPAHFSRAVENSFDAYHFWEVHRFFPFGRNAEDATSIAKEGRLLRIVTTKDGEAIEGSPALLYPNLWIQRFSKFATISIAFVPRAEKETEVHVRLGLHLTRIPGVKQAIAWFANKAWSFALWQDATVVAEQTPTRAEDSQDVFLGYDRPVLAYRKLRVATVKAARREAPAAE